MPIKCTQIYTLAYLRYFRITNYPQTSSCPDSQAADKMHAMETCNKIKEGDCWVGYLEVGH